MTTDVRHTHDGDWVAALRTQLVAQFEAQTARLTALTADTGDPAEDHNREALLATVRQNVAQISEALRRIAEGRYGVCDTCDSAIPRERMEIVPHARRCVPCQERRGN
ncbi:MAG TPA: TraR/DksA C4-type zinc finger protein [Pilimelia sp.]|nr:TraR/DksA C4-type zinc finger protein [Pilimelia sp.]